MAFNKKKMTGKQVKTAREKLAYTNQAFAAALGVSPRVIVLWQEKGASQLGSMAIRYILEFSDNAESIAT